MSRLVAFLGHGNIPLFLFKVTKETPQRFYGDMVERTDGRDPGWWYIRGFNHVLKPGKSYVAKGLTVPVANRASWDQCLPVMKHAIEAKELELKRLDKERRDMQERVSEAECQARMVCSQACLTELGKDV